MGSIPSDGLHTAITLAARRAALRFALPFDLAKLRAKAATIDADAAQTYAATIRARRDADGESYPAPTGQEIAEALESFSASEWPDLIRGCSLTDLRALLTSLYTDKDILAQAWGLAAYYGVVTAAGERAMMMSLDKAAKERRKFMRYDAYYVKHRREEQRRKNAELRLGRQEARSGMEAVSDTALAEELNRDDRPKKVSRKQVGDMFRRMEKTPFEEFEGDPDYYWWIMTDATAYNRFKKRLERGKE